MTPARTKVLIDAVAMAAAITGATVGGLAFGPLLSAGDADPGAFILPAIAAAMIVGGFAIVRRMGVRRWFLALWTLAGATFAALLLTGVAAERWPDIGAHALPDAPRVSLAVFSALDLEQAGQGALPVLQRRFAIRRLDVVTAAALADQPRMLLAQPRLMTPQELVDVDAWTRRGGTMLILADPLLLWPPDGTAAAPMPGDRTGPPLTSLLDPLLTHWGLRLEPASDEAMTRRFVGDRLLRLAGASRFAMQASPFADCDTEADGLMAVCAVGRGHVRLIADADLLDARLWRADDGRLASDAIRLVDHWLRAPSAPPPPGNMRMWVRGEADVRNGLRMALLFGIVWAILGAAMLWCRDYPGKAGTDNGAKQKA